MMIRRQGDWLHAKVRDELVMMSAATGKYLGLSDVGSRVWEMIEKPMEFDAICAQLQTEFDVDPETCRTEVKAFVDELVKHQAASVD